MKRALLIAVATTVALIVVLACVGRAANWPPPEDPPRQGEATSVKDPQHHSPEALAHLVREPQNTWSNLAFIFGGA